MKLRHQLTSALLAAVAVAADNEPHAFVGAVPVQYTAPGTALEIDLHRFVHPAASSRVRVDPPSGVQAAVNRESLSLHLLPNDKLRGIVDIPIALQDAGKEQQLIITIALRGRRTATFTYKPTTPSHSLAVAGSFNGWSKTALPMTATPDGTYRASIEIDPGTYTYKFVIDDKWITDPSNSATTSDGMGGTNSLLIVGDEPAAAPALYFDNRTGQTLVIHVVGPPIATCSAIAELPGGTMTTLPFESRDTSMTIKIDKLPAGSWVRAVGADENGYATNVVRCRVGDAAGEFDWRNALLYYAITDRFFDGDRSNDRPVNNPELKWPANFHGGDWRGIEEKIKQGYFKELGVTALWIAPLNENPSVAFREYPEPHRWYTGYHGYWPVSPDRVEPHFGKDADLRSLTKTAHKNGLKVIADLVLHHVHEQHPWWEQHRDWFGALELPDGTKNLRRWDDYQFTTWFEPYLPTFDFNKAAPIVALIDNSAWWAATYDLDGFRLDAVKHIPQSFWWKFRSALRDKVERKLNRRLYLVGETFKDRAGIASYIGPNMLDGQFDFPLYDSIKDAFGEGKVGLDTLASSLAASEFVYGKEALVSPLIGNHDKGRFMAYADGDLPGTAGVKEEEIGWSNPPAVDDPANYEKLSLAQAFLMAVDGVPMIYYGDEFGMTGAGDPDNRRDMRFGDQLTAPERKTLMRFERLTRIRSRHPSLRGGSRRNILVEKDALAFVRAQFDDRVLCVFNRANTPRTLQLNVGPELGNGAYVDEVSERHIDVTEGAMMLDMPARSAAFVTRAQSPR